MIFNHNFGKKGMCDSGAVVGHYFSRNIDTKIMKYNLKKLRPTWTCLKNAVFKFLN